MAIDVMSHVWKTSKQKGSALLLLIAIADSANDDGFAYPAVETLAEKTRVEIRTTQRMLDRLEASGELLIFNRTDPAHPERHYSNVYKIPVPGKENAQPPHVFGELKARVTTRSSDKFVTTPSEEVVTPVSLGSDSGVIRVVTAASLNPLIDPLVNQKDKKTRTKKERAPKPYDDVPHRVRTEIIEAWVTNLTAAPANAYKTDPNHNAAADIARAGYNAGDTARYVKAMMGEKFWKGKTLSLSKVAELMPAWLVNQRPKISAAVVAAQTGAEGAPFGVDQFVQRAGGGHVA